MATCIHKALPRMDLPCLGTAILLASCDLQRGPIDIVGRQEDLNSRFCVCAMTKALEMPHCASLNGSQQMDGAVTRHTMLRPQPSRTLPCHLLDVHRVGIRKARSHMHRLWTAYTLLYDCTVLYVMLTALSQPVDNSIHVRDH